MDSSIIRSCVTKYLPLLLGYFEAAKAFLIGINNCLNNINICHLTSIQRFYDPFVSSIYLIEV